jgi:hypothetical protein
MIATVTCWTAIAEGLMMPIELYEQVLSRFGPFLIVAFLLLPLVIWDYVRLTNRFAGPVLRLRRCMRKATAGENVQPITFRQNDFWAEFAQEFNALLAKVRKQSDIESFNESFTDLAHNETDTNPDNAVLNST